MTKNSEYEKMPSTLRSLNLSDRDLRALEKTKWAVTEKIHGANFSFVYEEHQLRYAKRKEYLAWTDDFFGFQLVVVDLEEPMMRLFERLRHEFPAHRHIVYGELFGGEYPHPAVDSVPHVQAIQTGVYYSPKILFSAFDIAIEAVNGTKHYLDYEQSMAYFERFGIPYAKVLFSGRWSDAMAFDTRIDSRIPALLGLPELRPNLIEGVVVKPLIHSMMDHLRIRPILKRKNVEFDEDKKFHEARKWAFVPDVTSRAERLQFLVNEMALSITKNRLDSATSKIGRIDPANPERMASLENEFVEDIFIDFNEESGGILDELSQSELSWLRARIAVRVTEFVSGSAE